MFSADYNDDDSKGGDDDHDDGEGDGNGEGDCDGDGANRSLLKTTLLCSNAWTLQQMLTESL